MKRFLSMSYGALVLGGALLTLGSGLSWAQSAGGDSFSVRAGTTAFFVSSLIRLAGATALLVGFSGVAVGQADRAGTFGLVAYLLVVTNLVLQAGFMWADTFLSGAVSAAAPEILNGDVHNARMSAGGFSAWILNTSILVLGIAVLRAHVFGRLAGWAMVVAGGITVLPLPFDGAGYEVIIGLACLTAGVVVVRAPRVQHPEPVLA